MIRSTKFRLVLVPAMVLAAFVLGSGCPQQSSGTSVLVDQTVQVAPAGGGAEVSFSGTAGQIISITLTGTPAAMEPYGDLQVPGSASIAAPANGASAGGVNTANVTLTQTGQYTLIVFDGANLGGSVAVKIETVSAI